LPFVTPISLGPRVLRADTAAVAALTLWQSVAGTIGDATGRDCRPSADRGVPARPRRDVDVPAVEPRAARDGRGPWPVDVVLGRGRRPGDHGHYRADPRRVGHAVLRYRALGGCGLRAPGREAIGVIGAREQSRPLIAALGLADAEAELDEDEPHFALTLADLVVPDGPGDLVPMSSVDRALMVDWRRRYCEEVLGAPAVTSRQRAEADIAGYLEADSHRVLVGPDGPICATGFNAATPDIVQIGGVYTPKELRGRGYARRAVALHLAEAREAGVASATLFASGASAVAAYEAIGFRRIGDWTIFITKHRERIGG
jgi:GNAT superfamily N-acetyltransferase